MKPERPIIKTEQKKMMGIKPNEQPMEIVHLGWPENLPCRDCKKKPRRNGSARCKKCSVNKVDH